MQVDTLILGAGAAGLYAAGRIAGRVLVVDHARAPGEKIRISGGGRCNFTNLYTDFDAFHGDNPHFHKSALSRHTQWDFIELVDRHRIPWHEKTLGQLFCDTTSRAIIDMLLAEMARQGAELWLQTDIGEVRHDGSTFHVRLNREGTTRDVTTKNLVLATGGKSIPKMGATGLAYRIAEDFGMGIAPTRPALVPLTFSGTPFAGLSGTSVPVRASVKGIGFEEAMLFTHRGLSGPAILQISSYWSPGENITLRLLPDTDVYETMRAARQEHGRKSVGASLAKHFPARLIDHLDLPRDKLADISDARLRDLTRTATDWTLKPTDTEGYRKAEVTAGGISTQDLDSQTMMSKTRDRLFVIGEAADVTGWLGGYNFQWAWSSAAAAADAINSA